MSNSLSISASTDAKNTPSKLPVSDVAFGIKDLAFSVSKVAPAAALRTGTPQPVAAAVVSTTQPNPLPAASTQEPIATLAWCNAWLQLTYAHELAGLTKLGAHVQARAVRAPGQKVSSSSSVLLTVKDGWFGGEAGLDGQLTFTFWDTDFPKVALGGLTMSQFQDMARRFWRALPTIKDVYQARAAYIAATGANPNETFPDVECRAGSMEFHWFTRDTLPKLDEPQYQYPRPKLLALAETYDQWAADGV